MAIVTKLIVLLFSCVTLDAAIDFIAEPENTSSCYDEVFHPACPEDLVLAGDMAIGVQTATKQNITESCVAPSHSCLCEPLPSPSELDRRCFFRHSNCKIKPEYKTSPFLRCGSCGVKQAPEYTVCQNCGCIYRNMSIDICGEDGQYIETTSGLIYSEDYPYQYHQPSYCSKHIVIQDSQSSAVVLESYHMNINPTDCVHHILVQQKQHGKVTEGRKFCGNESINITLTGEEVIVTFDAPTNLGSSHDGFLLSYKVIPYDVPSETTSEPTEEPETTEGSTLTPIPTVMDPPASLDVLTVVLIIAVCLSVVVNVALAIAMHFMCRKEQHRMKYQPGDANVNPHETNNNGESDLNLTYETSFTSGSNTHNMSPNRSDQVSRSNAVLHDDNRSTQNEEPYIDSEGDQNGALANGGTSSRAPIENEDMVDRHTLYSNITA